MIETKFQTFFFGAFLGHSEFSLGTSLSDEDTATAVSVVAPFLAGFPPADPPSVSRRKVNVASAPFFANLLLRSLDSLS